jgi:hypothetical protein
MTRVRTLARLADGSAPVPVWAGFVTSTEEERPSVSDAVVIFGCDGPFFPLASADVDRTEPVDGGDKSGERVTRVLDKPEVRYPASRKVEGGQSVLEPTTYGENALSYLQRVERSENGLLFEGREGSVVFFGRHRLLAEPRAIFGPDNIRGDVRVDTSATMLRNRVRTSGVSDVEFVAEDADSMGEFLPRALNRTDLLVGDDEAQVVGRYLLGRYSTAVPRVRRLDVDLAALSFADQRTVLELEIGDRVRVNVGDGFECVVEGVEHVKPLIGWRTTLFLSAADTTPYMRWDDQHFGRWDTFRWGY